ncbi:metal-nicotianamine transporter YSL1 [Citrus sinensis]|nr:metal-nicotianamine transporter YSL1 [Citrus x clementina]XP_006476298.2 metal-nicotianamine transporter YSL1 [Citrus sinensis]XP_024043922.1 metal-nicotianamine transporter YSL1 [Citrus x clementina]XP_052294519.1 metal-nicotianamine transporter YSL1 [Citrus sinensis]KAH9718955.1 metal-nicotianamine transporter YSL1 [Citrus sinensis]
MGDKLEAVSMQEEKEKKEIEREDAEEDDHVELSDPEGSNKRQQPWTKQITIRGLVVSILLGIVYSVIVMKLNLTTGLVPQLNVSAALLAFLIIRSWTKVLQRAGYVTRPFTKQENTMIQTCAVACYSIAVGGGFGSYLLGLSKKIYELSGEDTEGNSRRAIKEPGLGWMTGYLFVVCFVGLFVLIPLRKIVIVDLKLTYPSGLATAVLINGFHSQGDQMAKKQVGGFMKYFSISFLWGFFQWFYSGKESCGFKQFPTFGLQAWKQTFYFDFSMTYVGAGMICSHLVNLSLLLGAVLSYGMMWPLIDRLKGHWFSESLKESDMKSLYGYKVFLSVALILGDGLYNFLKILSVTVINIYGRIKTKNLNAADGDEKKKSLEDLKHNEIFLRENIPMWIGVAGYLVFSILSIIVIPIMFPQLKWYYVVIAYILAPSLSFCNAYGAGLTDINMAYNYGKVALFVLAALSGRENGLVAGMVGCGLVKSVVSVACILMQDFKTAHCTYTSPRAMFLNQVIGTAVGCVVAPISFLLFYKAFDVGNPHGEFKAPYALIYRNMAVIGVQGFSALPQHCLQLCYGLFASAVAVNLVRDFSPEKIGKWMPLPMVMALPFLVGAYFAIDMCVGSLVVYLWHKRNPKKAELMIPAVASGLICGEGLWTLPASILALAKIQPPLCMKFLDS